MNEDLKYDLIKICVKHGIIPDHYLRNEDIIEDYKKLKEKGIKSQEAKLILADKYFTSVKNVEKIIYHLNKKK